VLIGAGGALVKARRPSAERSQRLYDAHAGAYDRGIAQVERRVFGEHRRWAADRASGAVLELAVGTGLNLPLYGASVTSVLGVDRSAGMLDVARRRVRDHGLEGRVDLRQGDVQRLDLPGASVDTVLVTYALCSVPDPLAVLLEARRLLRPGGSLVLVEHGVAGPWPVRALQHAVQPLSVRFAADDLLGDPAEVARAAGFEVALLERGGRASLVHRLVARAPSA
jgi:ubiquinone/menaquinone biosynthesis C-methylase UbiE